MLENNISSNTFTQTVRYNGIPSSGTSSIGYFSPNSNTTFRIGDSNFTGNTFKGSMSEIMMYTPSIALTLTQIQKIEGYLAWKWGIQNNLPSSHLYYSSTPTA